MSERELKVQYRPEVSLLAPPVRDALREYRWRRAFNLFECLMNDEDHGTKGVNPPIIPYIPGARRTVVYYGNGFNGAYNHHNQINKFKGRYYYAWSNGVRNEEDAGQKVLLSVSDDALVWQDPIEVPVYTPTPEWAHNCVALYTDEEQMVLLVMSEETEHDETVTGMRRVKPEEAYVDAYRSLDGVHFEKAFECDRRIKWLFEAPRLTHEGRLMCVCCTKADGPGILLWPGKDISQTPKLILVDEPEEASFPYGESTWYQLDSGRILVFWRDEGASCRIWCNWSEDGGETWTAPALSDIPDSMSRIYAGRLSDGRYFIVNNAISNLLDRRPLTLLISEDGVLFDKVYMINDDPAEMRCKGLLKANGHQYPCCLVEEGKLIVAYDNGKEDIMCEVIPTDHI